MGKKVEKGGSWRLKGWNLVGMFMADRFPRYIFSTSHLSCNSDQVQGSNYQFFRSTYLSFHTPLQSDGNTTFQLRTLSLD